MIIIVVELLLIAIPCLYFSLKFPPSSVAICLLFSLRESTGLGLFLQQYAPHAYMIITACLFIAYLRSLAYIRRERTIYYSKAKFRFFSRLIFVISFLMLISILVNGYSVFSLVFLVPLSTVIAVVYWQNKAAIRLYLIILTIHLTIATVLTSSLTSSFHWLSVLSAYPNQSAVFAIGSRQSAQFAHVIQLAYYGGIGLITGMWLARQANTRKLRIFGFYLTLISFWITLVTSTRAIWFALLLAVVYAIYRKIGLKHTMIKLCFVSLILLLAIIHIEDYTYNDDNTSYNIIASRFASMKSTEFQEESYRIVALKRSIDVIYKKPIFGYGNFYDLLDEITYMPHQMTIYYATMYGLPVGLCVLLLLIMSIRFDLSLRPYRTPSISNIQMYRISPNSRYFSAIAWLNILVALTNGSGGRMFQWVIMGVCCARWVCKPIDNKVVKNDLKSMSLLSPLEKQA